VLYPAAQISDTAVAYLPAFRKRNVTLYQIILLMVAGAITALPFLHTSVSIKATGITRPVTERTEIKPVLTGIIEKLLYKEGAFVQEGATIVTIRDDNSPVQTVSNAYDMTQRQQFIHDLQLLTTTQGSVSIERLNSPLYRQQLNRFQYQLTDQQASLKKVQRELEVNDMLLKEKVIAPKEAFDKQVENEKMQAAYQTFVRNQMAQWQQDLVNAQAELSQLSAARSKIHADKKNYEIKAPVSGVLQGINNLYEGSVVQAGQSIATVSPESNLIAECYVSTRDVGLLQPEQEVRFQIDAFDYNYFGILTGKIISIDNDFTVVENQPVFKIRCSFDGKQLHLKNGFTGQLKKGLTLQARFVIAERSLWQLLFDKIDNWLNPTK
jgi:HlyD family secretion protein